MKKTEYRLVALDLDGTLLSSRQTISPRTHAALQAARAQGILPVVTTGRTPHSAMEWSRAIGGGPVICCNGAGLLDAAGAWILHRQIPDALLQRLLEIAAGRAVVHCLTPVGTILDRPFQYARHYLQWVQFDQQPAAAVSSMFRNFWRNRTKPVRSLVRWASEPGRPPVLKVMLFAQAGSLGPLEAEMRQALPTLEISSSGDDNLEVTAAGVTKASGLERLAARLKVPREAIIAFGDSDNDREMLQYAGLGVAMGTAPDAVKAVADRVTASCDEDGVAQVLEELCRA